MEINKNVRDRIFAAADALFLEAERRNFPTVDAVRKRASVNMNDASTGMKEWRRLQTATLEDVPNQLPAELSASCVTAVSALWKEATAMANESLRAAQAGWEAERSQINDLSRQMAVAYDLQSDELKQAGAEIEKLKADIESLLKDLAVAKKERDSADRDRGAAEVKAFEIGRRADDLRAELERAHADSATVRAEIAAVRAAYDEQLGKIRDQARRHLDNERELADRDKARSEETLRLALQEGAQLRSSLVAALTATAPRKNRTRQVPNGGVSDPANPNT
jgi:colicin import membrane protein